MAILAVTIILSACKKERANIDTRPLPEPPKKYRLSKIKQTDNAQYWEHSFVYNNKGYLAAYSRVWKSYGRHMSTENLVFEYDGRNRLIRETTRQDGEPELTGIYSYNGDTLKRKDYMEGNEMQSYVLYRSYNGKITGKTWYGMDGSTVSGESLLYDMHGNLAEFESWSLQGYRNYRVDNILHDDKPNCYRTIKGPEDMSYLNGFDPQALSANNVISFESEQDSFGERTLVHLLEYNEHNYLSKLSRYGGYEVFEYEYEEY